ncbi:MAG TPA: hypothetical protein VLQ68_04175 [Rhizobiaceae bacterium]|nr:hypothetical protein [Rhizobiaceae bacterium]
MSLSIQSYFFVNRGRALRALPQGQTPSRAAIWEWIFAFSREDRKIVGTHFEWMLTD